MAGSVIDAGETKVMDVVVNGDSEGQKKYRIQVSNTKKPLFFYLNLAKRYIKQNNDVELSALGMAIPTVVTIAEILKSSGWAKQKKIVTSTVGAKDEYKGRLVLKAKIEIVLVKAENFEKSAYTVKSSEAVAHKSIKVYPATTKADENGRAEEENKPEDQAGKVRENDVEKSAYQGSEKSADGTEEKPGVTGEENKIAGKNTGNCADGITKKVDNALDKCTDGKMEEKTSNSPSQTSDDAAA